MKDIEGCDLLRSDTKLVIELWSPSQSTKMSSMYRFQKSGLIVSWLRKCVSS